MFLSPSVLNEDTTIYFKSVKIKCGAQKIIIVQLGAVMVYKG